MKMIPTTQPAKPQIRIKVSAQEVGANILAEQNRARITLRSTETNAQANRRTNIIRSRNGYTSPYANDYNRLCNTGEWAFQMNPEKARELQSKFFNETGLTLHIPASSTGGFNITLDSICSAVNEGSFPKDIKHVLIGHGMGSSTAKTWALEGRGLKDGNIVEIIPYINKNVPKGEKVLVASCEQGVKFANKPGIGDEVQLSLDDLSAPGKVVRSGIDRIIGHYTKTGGFYLMRYIPNLKYSR